MYQKAHILLRHPGDHLVQRLFRYLYQMVLFTRVLGQVSTVTRRWHELNNSVG